MYVNKPLSGLNATSQNASVHSVTPKTEGVSNKEAVTPASRVDHVQISDAARRMVEQSNDGSTAESLAPARRQEIIARLQSGAYQSWEIADHVARAIINRSDI